MNTLSKITVWLSLLIISLFSTSCMVNELMGVKGNRQVIDEIRTIDWNVTARFNDPYVKVFEEEREWLYALFDRAVNEEKRWAQYLFKDGSIIGLNEAVLHQYIDWLCHSRRKAIGLPYETGFKNPISGWTDSWMNSESVQVAPQEHEITSYKIGASKNDLDDMDLGDLL